MIPVIISPCAWQEVAWLAELQVRPWNGKPIWGEADSMPEVELAKLTREIAGRIRQLNDKREFDPTTIRILLADDHFFARDGLRQTVDSQEDMVVVGEVEKRTKIVAQVAALKPDVLVLDLAWLSPENDAIDVIHELRHRSPAAGILAVTNYRELLERARQAGAHHAMLKTVSKSEWLDAIRIVNQKRT